MFNGGRDSLIPKLGAAAEGEMRLNGVAVLASSESQSTLSHHLRYLPHLTSMQCLVGPAPLGYCTIITDLTVRSR